MRRPNVSSLARLAGSALALAAVSLAVLAACGGDDDNGGGTTSPVGSSPAATSGPGTITVTSSSPITGQSKKVLLVYAAPGAGGGIIAEACIQLTSDRVSVPASVMTDKKGDQAPCTGNAAKTTFPEGTYTLTAGIYAPPAQAAEKEVKLSVQVRGDVTVQIDGGALSK